jgi:membrane-bound serine protease (ClpP class)
MTPVGLAILCFVGGIVLLIAEILLPSHGVLGAIGTIGLLVGVGACFFINQYIGLGASVALVAIMPLAVGLWLKVWPHTYAGKRLILAPTTSATTSPDSSALRVGDLGVVVSELRPGGLCEFGGSRFESRCERGTISAGHRVQVIAVVDARPVVRAV